MNVTFTRTGERRYSVSVDGSDIDPATMDPAPGFDPKLPHDVAHFIVENELGILGGVYGQLASGGTAGTFYSSESKRPRKAKRRGALMAKMNKADALFSEHAVYAARTRWEGGTYMPETKIPAADIERICGKFDEFANIWSRLPVGGDITLKWTHSGKAAKPGR